MKKEELKKQNYKEYLKQFKKEFEVHRELRIKETPKLLYFIEKSTIIGISFYKGNLWKGGFTQ